MRRQRRSQHPRPEEALERKPAGRELDAVGLVREQLVFGELARRTDLELDPQRARLESREAFTRLERGAQAYEFTVNARRVAGLSEAARALGFELVRKEALPAG